MSLNMLPWAKCHLIQLTIFWMVALTATSKLSKIVHSRKMSVCIWKVKSSKYSGDWGQFYLQHGHSYNIEGVGEHEGEDDDIPIKGVKSNNVQMTDLYSSSPLFWSLISFGDISRGFRYLLWMGACKNTVTFTNNLLLLPLPMRSHKLLKTLIQRTNT